MDGIGEQGLFIIAALVIAFINWLSGTLKKKQAAQRGDDEQSQAHLREVTEDPQAQSDHDSWPSPDDGQNSRPQAASNAEQPVDPNRELREFFTALSGSPPVQAPPVTVIEETLPIQPPPFTEPAPVPEYPPSKGHYSVIQTGGSSRRNRIHPIIRKLRREGGAREAFIFSEILCKPKALRKTNS